MALQHFGVKTSSAPMKASSKFQKYFELSQPLNESIQKKEVNNVEALHAQAPKNKDVMDLKSVVNTFENERISKLDRPSFIIQPNKPKPTDKSKRSVKALSFVDEDFEEKVYSPINRLSNNNTEKQEFLPNYQQRGFKSILLFIIFVLLILLEMFVTVLSFRNRQQTGTNIISIAFIVLSSQAAYELIVKYTIKIENKSLSVRERINRLKGIKENWTKKITKKENIISVLLVVLITAAYWCYFEVLNQDCLLANNDSEDSPYLICDLFWANILIPILLEKYYFTKSFQSKRGKFTIFMLLLAVMAALILISNRVLFALFLIKVCITVIKFKSQYDLSWISDVSSFLLIIGVLLLIFARKVLGVTNEDFTFMELLLTAGEYIILITLAILVTRCLTRVYLQKWLFQRLYNEAHINLAFILSALIITLPYVALFSLPVILRVAADVGMVWIVYLQGAESFQVSLMKAESDYSSF